MKQREYADAMRNAEASLRMEGLLVTPEMREQCASILRGEMSVTECLRLFYVSATGREGGK